MGNAASLSQVDNNPAHSSDYEGNEPTNLGCQNPLKDCNAVLFQEFILNGVTDGKTPLYVGITCLSDGRVVIVDLNNCRCCLYDSFYKHKSDFMLSSGPYTVCAIDTDEVAVTLLAENKIQFLKICDTIQPSGHINTRRTCLSVVALNKMELVYVGTTVGDRTYYWGIITRDGRENTCFHIPCGVIQHCDVCIALNSSKTHAYISCYDNKTVYCVGLDGKTYFEYKIQNSTDEDCPLGIELDRENNVYVVIHNSASILQLSPECRLQRTFKNTIPQYPRAICFKKSGDRFLLTNNCLQSNDVCYEYILR